MMRDPIPSLVAIREMLTSSPDGHSNDPLVTTLLRETEVLVARGETFFAAAQLSSAIRRFRHIPVSDDASAALDLAYQVVYHAV
jgi:hypothetical protein